LLALKFAFQIFTFFLFNAEIYIYFILSVNIFWKFQATFQANYSNIALCTFNKRKSSDTYNVKYAMNRITQRLWISEYAYDCAQTFVEISQSSIFQINLLQNLRITVDDKRRYTWPYQLCWNFLNEISDLMLYVFISLINCSYDTIIYIFIAKVKFYNIYCIILFINNFVFFSFELLAT